MSEPLAALNVPVVTPAVYGDDIQSAIDVYDPKTGMRVRQIPDADSAALAVDESGDLYAAVFFDHVVKVYKPGASTPFRTLGDAGGRPFGVALDAAHNVYAAVQMTGRGRPGQVVVYKPNATKPFERLHCPTDVIRYFNGVAVDKGGDIFAWGAPAKLSQTEYIAEIPQGKPCRLLDRVVTGGNSAVTLTSNDDLVLVMGAYRAEIFARPYTRVKKTITLTDNDGAVQVALSKDERSLWVVDGDGGTIREYPFPEGGAAEQTIYDETADGNGVAVAPAFAP
jgi:sugar lactone lactonase YvrE